MGTLKGLNFGPGFNAYADIMAKAWAERERLQQQGLMNQFRMQEAAQETGFQSPDVQYVPAPLGHLGFTQSPDGQNVLPPMDNHEWAPPAQNTDHLYPAQPLGDFNPPTPGRAPQSVRGPAQAPQTLSAPTMGKVEQAVGLAADKTIHSLESSGGWQPSEQTKEAIITMMKGNPDMVRGGKVHPFLAKQINHLLEMDMQSTRSQNYNALLTGALGQKGQDTRTAATETGKNQRAATPRPSSARSQRRQVLTTLINSKQRQLEKLVPAPSPIMAMTGMNSEDSLSPDQKKQVSKLRTDIEAHQAELESIDSGGSSAPVTPKQPAPAKKAIDKKKFQALVDFVAKRDKLDKKAAEQKVLQTYEVK